MNEKKMHKLIEQQNPERKQLAWQKISAELGLEQTQTQPKTPSRVPLFRKIIVAACAVILCCTLIPLSIFKINQNKNGQDSQLNAGDISNDISQSTSNSTASSSSKEPTYCDQMIIDPTFCDYTLKDVAQQGEKFMYLDWYSRSDIMYYSTMKFIDSSENKTFVGYKEYFDFYCEDIGNYYFLGVVIKTFNDLFDPWYYNALSRVCNKSATINGIDVKYLYCNDEMNIDVEGSKAAYYVFTYAGMRYTIEATLLPFDADIEFEPLFDSIINDILNSNS